MKREKIKNRWEKCEITLSPQYYMCVCVCWIKKRRGKRNIWKNNDQKFYKISERHRTTTNPRSSERKPEGNNNKKTLSTGTKLKLTTDSLSDPLKQDGTLF